MKTSLGIVITCYNRSKLVCRAIMSVLDEGLDLVVVDDCSVDDSVQVIHNTFKEAIKSGRLAIVINQKNLGVTGSKNVGYRALSNSFVGFLDSDDWLVEGASELIIKETIMFPGNVLYFFRCRDHHSREVGHVLRTSQVIDLFDFLNNTTRGETFAVVDRRFLTWSPYIGYFRGYEGIGCARMLEKQQGLLSSKVVRVYDTGGADRLSVGIGLSRRRNLLTAGHILMLRRYYSIMSWRCRVKYILRIIKSKLF